MFVVSIGRRVRRHADFVRDRGHLALEADPHFERQRDGTPPSRSIVVCNFALRCSGPRVFQESAVLVGWMVRRPVLKSHRLLVVDIKELIFLEIAACVCQICHSTTGLASATPPSEAIAWPLASWHPLLSTDLMWSLRRRESSLSVILVLVCSLATVTQLPLAGVHEWLLVAVTGTAVSGTDILASEAEDDVVRASVWMISFAEVERG